MTATPDTETVPITLRSPQDLLASIPYQLGFRPTESVVLACVSRHRRLELVARLDLDDLTVVEDPSGIETLARAVAQVDPVWCALVVYSACGEDEVAGPVALVRGVVGRDVELDEWHVTPWGYRGIGCHDATCCPDEGHPLEALEASPAGAAHVLAGRYAAASAEEAFGIMTADRAARGLAARAARRCEAAASGVGADETRWRQDSLSTWRAALRQTADAFLVPDAATGPALLGRVAAGLADRRLRDAALLTLVPGGDAAADGTLDGAEASDAATARAMASVTDPASAVRPDPELARCAVAVLERTVAHAPGRLAPAPLTLLAFLAWWQGDGPRAAYRLKQVHDVDPDYRLALLLGSVLTAGLPPGWIRAQSQGGAVSNLTSSHDVR